MLRSASSESDNLTVLQRVLICILALASCAPFVLATARGRAGQSNAKSPQSLRGETGSGRAEYESWIRAYRKGPLRGSLGNNHKIVLEITVITGDDLPLDAKTASVLGRNYRTTWSSYGISTTGTISSRTITPLGGQEGCCQAVPTGDFKKLRPLIRNLPNDHYHLPPLGHRLVLQVPKGTGVLARVYDRANMPEKVLEILRLTGLDINPKVPDFEPDKKWPKGEFDKAGIPPDAIGIVSPRGNVTLGVSPVRSLVVKQSFYSCSRTQIVDSKTLKVVHEINERPMGRQVICDSRAWFTPDGRFLLLLNNRPAVRIFNTRTWQELDSLPGLPSGEVAYYPSSDWAHGVVVSAVGETWLWDAKAGRKLARLHLDGEIQSASFSPDNSLVAVTSVRNNKDASSTFHLRLWESNSGKFVHELFPLEHFEHDEIGNPMWWKDGRYLLAPIRENHFGGSYVVGIWNVRSGRYRGEFSGCEYSDDPFSILLQGQWLFKHCRSGTLYRWDVAAAINRIKAFENTLTPPPANAGTTPSR